MRALILEDNRDRRVAMISRLMERFPFLRVVFFESAEEMIAFLAADAQPDVAVVALDHDLDMLPGRDGIWIDPGTGWDVARWLAERPPMCPVIVHTTNARGGDQMMAALQGAHWSAHRVVPHGDLEWIETEWFRTVRNAIVDFTPRPAMSAGPLKG